MSDKLHLQAGHTISVRALHVGLLVWHCRDVDLRRRALFFATLPPEMDQQWSSLEGPKHVDERSIPSTTFVYTEVPSKKSGSTREVRSGWKKAFAVRKVESIEDYHSLLRSWHDFP